jgi:hypothetical protein
LHLRGRFRLGFGLLGRSYRLEFGHDGRGFHRGLLDSGRRRRWWWCFDDFNGEAFLRVIRPLVTHEMPYEGEAHDHPSVDYDRGDDQPYSCKCGQRP